MAKYLLLKLVMVFCLCSFLNGLELCDAFSGTFKDIGVSEENVRVNETIASAETAIKERLAIITSFPPEFYKPFISRFEKLYPAIQIQVLNKKTTAALSEIERGNVRKFDLFWSSSTDAFEVLQLSNKLKRSEYKLKYPALEIKGVNLYDHKGYFYSFALSSVGYMWNNSYLHENGLQAPTSWQSLADSSYYGHMAMSTPSRSGTTHLIVESILQGMGWQEGWRYLLKIAGNFSTVTARSFSVPEGIVDGRFGVGLVIDFLAQGQICIHKNIDFRYGEPIMLVPAGIGLLKNGTNLEAALKFLDFVLSPAGQKILLLPTLSRLPILTDVYNLDGSNLPELLHLINQNKIYPYDIELSRTRYNIVNSMFDQLITYRLLERRRIWKSLIKFEKSFTNEGEYQSIVKENVLDSLCTIPISSEQSVDRDLNTLLGSGGNGEKKRRVLQNWDDFVSRQLKQANNFLDRAWETMPVIHE
ncbi:MAG: extracellular solute-binding protein [Deltaproteobacteria bacterium]|nr:extracellular solute-binding protein [Deltaproteobacteria bacterium]